MSEIIKNSVNVQIINFLIFYTFRLQYTIKSSWHYNYGAKKYSFGSTIVGHILVFDCAKNSNIAI